ncbi:hypothetical protein DFP73DRAFT_551709 [Morchella snyderi]|nr:hypothetical protein DFP73DRAFT_551709 [Morchella snyderi]
MSRRHNRIAPSADGWSNIVGKGRAPLRKPSELTKLHNSLSNSSTPDYTAWHPTAVKNLATATSDLNCSPLLQTLAAALTSTSTPPITSVVVLGLGSLHGPTYTSSLLQLSLALALSKLLAAKLYLQDPAFSTADTHFLTEELGATILVDPEAQARIGAEALLFAPHLEYEVLQSALRARPGVVLANDVAAFMDLKINAAAAYPEFVECLRECDAVVLTGVDGSEDIGGGRAFNHTALYVRREKPLPEQAENGEKEGQVGEGMRTAKKNRRRNRKRRVNGVEVSVDDVIKGMNSIAL